MVNYLIRQVANLRRDEDGQMAIAVVIALPIVFIFLALGFDAGLWYFDHRTAQNQADAAVLAAAQFLPADVDSQEYWDAVDAVDLWVTKNGSNPDELDCGGGPIPAAVVIEQNKGTWFYDMHPAPPNQDGRLDAVRVCVGRESPGFFAAISGIPWVHVSAAAMARVGPSHLANVKPWAIAPRNPECRNASQLCFHDPNDMYDPYDINDSNGNWDEDDDNWNGPDGNLGDGITPEPDGDLEPCGFYPPIPPPFTVGILGSPEYADPAGLGLCPWGLHADMLQVFKVGANAKYMPGNFAPIQACGESGPGGNVYKECIDGDKTSGFYKVGDTVQVDIETGNMVGPTMQGLEGGSGVEGLYADEPCGGMYGIKTVTAGASTTTEDKCMCDVQATPHPVTGMDPDGKDRADATYAVGRDFIDGDDDSPFDGVSFDFLPGCESRLVSIVVIDKFPQGSGTAEVLGVATYSIAAWDRTSPNKATIGNDSGPLPPTPHQSCGQGVTEWDGVTGGYECGQVWGYFMQGVKPPEVLLQISDTDNPFAPVFIAMVE